MLLTFSRHQNMYNVSNVILCAEVLYHSVTKQKTKSSTGPRIISSIVSDLCLIP